MFRMLVAAAAVGLFAAQECRAQFVDNFDGDALAPHWEIWGEPSHLQHHVGGGLLTVTGLPYPSGMKSPTNNASIVTQFAPVSGDFVARAVVGWDAGEGRTLQFNVSSATALLGSMWYYDYSPGLGVQGGSGLPMLFPAPAPGMHEFMLVRQGSVMRAYVNDNFLTSFPASSTSPVQSVQFGFTVAYPNAGMSPMHVDFIQIIPSPSAPLLVALGMPALTRRWRQ